MRVIEPRYIQTRMPLRYRVVDFLLSDGFQNLALAAFTGVTLGLYIASRLQ